MRGLDLFKKHFSDFKDKYVLIGGTACTVLLNDVGEDFRATKDLDIVLIVENVNREFAEQFWEFIKAGNYNNMYKGLEYKNFYRFEKPANSMYPVMIELFSRVPTDYEIVPDSHLFPLHIADDISSLSAILLNDDYYNFLLSGRIIVNGLSVLNELHLIPFKAKAWCELTDRHSAGEVGLTKHLKKHKKDIAILLTLISEEEHQTLEGGVLKDMKRFVEEMKIETLDSRTTGVKNMTTELFCSKLRKIYIL